MRIKGLSFLYRCNKCQRTSVGRYHDELGRGSYTTVKCDGCGKRGASDKPTIDLLYTIKGFKRIINSQFANHDKEK